MVGSAIIIEIVTPFEGWGASWEDYSHAINVLAIPDGYTLDRVAEVKQIMQLLSDRRIYAEAIARANANAITCDGLI